MAKRGQGRSCGAVPRQSGSVETDDTLRTDPTSEYTLIEVTHPYLAVRRGLEILTGVAEVKRRSEPAVPVIHERPASSAFAEEPSVLITLDVER